MIRNLLSGSKRSNTIKRTKPEVLLGSCRGALLYLTGLNAFMGENTGGLSASFHEKPVSLPMNVPSKTFNAEVQIRLSNP